MFGRLVRLTQIPYRLGRFTQMADRDVSMGSGGIYMSNPNAAVLHFGITCRTEAVKPKPRKKAKEKPSPASPDIRPEGERDD